MSGSASINPLSELEIAIGYTFRDRRLVARALIHASVNDSFDAEVRTAERLSWLGDAILHMIVSDTLFSTHQDATKDQLHKMRKALTENTTLGRVGSMLGVERAAKIGASLTGNMAASDRHRMVAGILEGVLAAVYQDAGIDKTRIVVLRILQKELEQAGSDYKLQ